MAEQQSLVDEPRKRAYVWPTWVTKLLAGESRCWYSAWYKAHHKYLKRPDDQDREAFFAEYNETHDRLVAQRAKELRADGWTVKVEDEGEFKVRGANGDLAGKPDLVAMRGDEALVVEGKSGKPRRSDHWQAVLYVIFLPMTWLRGFKTIRAEIEYRDETVDVRPVTDQDRKKVQDALRLVTGSSVPEATPGPDCKFCDIARCAYRRETDEGDSGGMF